MGFASHRSQLLKKMTALRSGVGDFETLALEIFSFQARYNPVYAEFLSLINCRVEEIARLKDIPCGPVSLFKTHRMMTGKWEPETGFSSSGTTGNIRSRHYIRDVMGYLKNTRLAFEKTYGPLNDYCVLALLPSYLEREGSSLIAMAQHFIECSGDDRSGFFLYDLEKLADILKALKEENKPVLLLGVSFALVDLAEKYPMDLSGMTLMETGGMKGRRREMTREELHTVLKEAFQLTEIHSEYGMTEMQSQAYARYGGLFKPASTMRVLIREIRNTA